MTNSSKTGARLRLTGTIEHSDRGPLLRCDDDHIWKLELQDVELPAGSGSAIVEGDKSGFDQLDVDWIGAASSS